MQIVTSSHWVVPSGAAMAVGLSCAGTGMQAAVTLLEPLLTDAVDFVRQGALIATALVLIQQPEAQVPRLPSPQIRLLHACPMCCMAFGELHGACAALIHHLSEGSWCVESLIKFIKSVASLFGPGIEPSARLFVNVLFAA